MNKLKFSVITALLMTGALPGGLALAQTQPVASTESATADSQSTAAPIPAIVQKTLNQLYAIEPALKQLTEISSWPGGEESHRFYIDLSSAKDPDAFARIDVDSKTGELLYYSIELPQPANQPATKPASDQVIKQKAEQFITALYGAEKRKQVGEPQLTDTSSRSQLDEDDSGLSAPYRTVHFPALLNGIELSGSSFGPYLELELDGKVTSYSIEPLNLTGVAIPDPKKALSQAAIKQKIFAPKHLELTYTQAQPKRYSANGEPLDVQPALQYTYGWIDAIDAVSGKAVSTYTGAEISEQKYEPAIVKTISQKPQAKQLVAKTEDEAKAVIKELFEIDFAKTPLVENEAEECGKSYCRSWYSSDGKYVTLTTNGTTGVVEDAVIWDDAAIPGKRISRDDALKKALAVLEKYAAPTSVNVQVKLYEPLEPQKLPEWVAAAIKEQGGDGPTPDDDYFISVAELNQEVPIIDRKYYLTVSATTGKLTSYTPVMPSEKVALPEKKPAITIEQAAHVYEQNVPLTLSYIWPYYYGQRAPAPILVYEVDESAGYHYVNAITGAYQLVPVETK